jgi:beta-N-acetylhexosaminidase
MTIRTPVGALAGRREPGRPIEEAEAPRWPFSAANITPVERLTLRQKVGQLITVEIPEARLTPQIARFIRHCHPGGVAVFGRNLAGPWATAQLISDLQGVAAAAGDAPLLIGIDQEGGQVSRLRYPAVELPSNMACNAAGGAAAGGAAAEMLGTEMAAMGINLAYAPVADTNTNPANPVIGTRAYSDDPRQVAACVTAAIAGWRRAGVFSMVKHFPGHGDTLADSHLKLPSVHYGWDRIESVELVPFRAAIAAGVDTVCSAHVRFPGIDDSGLPATLSPRLMTDLLRKELGFQGALFADALVMDAIAGRKGGNIPPAAVAAINAGVDCVMILGSLRLQSRVYDTLLGAVLTGIISEQRLDEAVARVYALRLKATAPPVMPAWPIEAHRREADRLAHAAVTLVRDRDHLLPVTTGRGLGVVEFASGSVSPVETNRNEPLGASTLLQVLARRFPETRFLALHDTAPNAGAVLDGFLAGCEHIIVVTRSAVIDPHQARLLERVAASDKPIIQLALRIPYDANLVPAIGTVLLTYGDQPSSVIAAADVLTGDSAPTGRLPVDLDVPLPEPQPSIRREPASSAA